VSARGGGSSRVLLAALLATTAAIKLALAWAFPGFLSGDDFEIVATAAKYAVGLDYAPWPIRSLFHPLLLAFPLVKAGALAGLTSPRWLTLLAAVPTAAFSTLGVWLAYRVARELEASEPAARVSAFLAATAWVPFAYGGTQYPRPISSALLLGAFLLLVRRGAAERSAAFAGLLTAAACAVRWSEGVALLPFAGVAIARENGLRRVSALAAGFAGGILLFVGIFDWLTWGVPFASPRAFLAFLPAAHEAYTKRPPWWYGGMVLQWAGPILVLLGLFAVRDRRARVPLFVAVSFVALLSPTSLKGVRYVMFAVLLLAVAAALGWERLWRAGRFGRAAAIVLLAAAVPYCAERSLHLLRGKSQSAIAAARFLAARAPRVRRVVLEQSWAYGERLYLGNGVRVADVPPRAPLAAARVLAAAEGCDAAALYADDVDAELSAGLGRAGFHAAGRFAVGPSRAVAVFLRDAPPQNGQ
jgi:hypothetical protein